MIRPQLEEFVRRMAPNSDAIIPGARETTRSNDTHYRFRQDSDFFYLTGFEEPDSIAVLKSSGPPQFTLFVRPRDPEREIWDGRRAGVDGAKKDFGADEAFPISEFDLKLHEILDGPDILYYRLGVNRELDDTLIRQISRMRAGPCTPQTCDGRCLACRIHGRPFYSHGDLQYLEHGTGPLAAELERLWRAKGTMRGGTAREGCGDDGGGWRALPRGAAGLVPRRPQVRPVTELYYPGLQDPPPDHDGRNASGS